MNTTRTARLAEDLRGGDRILDSRMCRTLEVFDTFPLNGREMAVRVILPGGRVETRAFLVGSWVTTVVA